MKAIVHTNIVLPDHIVRDGSVLIDGNRIAAVGRNIELGDAEIFDAQGAYTGPGLIDIHTHADGRYLFYEDPIKVAKTLLDHGVTAVLPALYFNAGKDQLLRQINIIKNAMASGRAPNIIGIYMEAPYLNPAFGCNRESNPWQGPIEKEDYKPLIDAAAGYAKVWCVAPERDGIENFVRDVKAADSGAVFSVAHSEAEPWQIERLMQYGLMLGTHHTNATGTIHRYPECRSACVDETVLYNDNIYAELIVDKEGIHVDPYLQRLIKRIKGDEKIILIADAFVEHGPVPPGYEGADDINFDFSGEIAGTKLILDAACRNMMFHTGASLCQVFRYASTNPATLLSMTDRGVVAEGKRADLVVVDAEMNIINVLKDGNFL